MKRRVSRILLFAAATASLAGCVTPPLASVTATERSGIEARLMQDIGRLASDEFGGRKPGTDGERLTTDLIIAELQAAGLQSGTNDPGNAWRAPVDLISVRLNGGTVSFQMGRKTFELTEKEAVVFTSRPRNLTEGAEIVFVGFEAEEIPEDVVAGKVVLMLGDPGKSPQRRENLQQKRPAAILTIVDGEEEVAQFSRVIGQDRVSRAAEEPDRFGGYVTAAALARVLGDKAWGKMRSAADTDAFQPVSITGTASIEATAFRREFTSHNVIGKLPGTKPGSGAVLLLGHWDHLGECGDEADEDRICNGAVDNASGIAVMLELARRLAAGGPHERDIYVLATSAEESGLLGAQAFIEDPPIPLDTIVAAFNFDTIAVAPAGSKVGFVGEGETPLDTVIREVVAKAGRELGDKAFAESFLRRQDGWALLQEGVPAVMLSSAFSSEIVLGPFMSADYHRASDEIETIELGGAIDDLLLHEELVRRFANTALYPWPQDQAEQ